MKFKKKSVILTVDDGDEQNKINIYDVKNGGINIMAKKILCVLAIILVLAQFSAVMSVNIDVKKGAPDIDGILSPGEWDEAAKYVMDKANIINYNGIGDFDDMTNDMGVTFYFSYADNGIYIAADVNDNTFAGTESWDPHGSVNGVRTDLIQFIFWAHDEFKWIDFGIYANGTDVAIRGHDQESEDDNFIEKGAYGKASLKANGSGYYIEAFLPWELINVDKQYTTGTVIPVMFMYTDVDDDGDQVWYKTADVDIWGPDDSIDNFLTLSGDAYPPSAPPQPEEPEEPEVPEVPAEQPETPIKVPEPSVKTGDETIFIILIGLTAICGAFTIYKKIKA